MTCDMWHEMCPLLKYIDICMIFDKYIYIFSTICGYCKKKRIYIYIQYVYVYVCICIDVCT